LDRTALLIWALKLEKDCAFGRGFRKTLAPAGLPSVFPLTAAERPVSEKQIMAFSTATNLLDREASQGEISR